MAQINGQVGVKEAATEHGQHFKGGKSEENNYRMAIFLTMRNHIIQSAGK